MRKISLVLLFSPLKVSKILFFCSSSVVLSMFATKTKSITANEANICGEKVIESFLSLTWSCKIVYQKRDQHNPISLLDNFRDVTKTNLSNLLDSESLLTPAFSDIFTSELNYGRVSTIVFSNLVSLPNYPREEGLNMVILEPQKLNLQILPFSSLNTADPSLRCFFTTMQPEGNKTWTVHWIRFEKSSNKFCAVIYWFHNFLLRARVWFPNWTNY